MADADGDPARVTAPRAGRPPPSRSWRCDSICALTPNCAAAGRPITAATAKYLPASVDELFDILEQLSQRSDLVVATFDDEFGYILNIFRQLDRQCGPRRDHVRRAQADTELTAPETRPENTRRQSMQRAGRRSALSDQDRTERPVKS